MSLHKNYYRQILFNVRKIVKCGICGHRFRIEFHHIKPTKLNGNSRGSSKRAWDIIKHPDCYIPLCYFCHQKVTSKEIFILKHPNGWGWETLWISNFPIFDIDQLMDMEIIHVI